MRAYLICKCARKNLSDKEVRCFSEILLLFSFTCEIILESRTFEYRINKCDTFYSLHICLKWECCCSWIDIFPREAHSNHIGSRRYARYCCTTIRGRKSRELLGIRKKSERKSINTSSKRTKYNLYSSSSGSLKNHIGIILFLISNIWNTCQESTSIHILCYHNKWNRKKYRKHHWENDTSCFGMVIFWEKISKWNFLLMHKLENRKKVSNLLLVYSE